MKSRASINSCTYEFKIRNGYLNELERVKKKLAGWKANLLSLASRAILIQASTTTIPSYVMHCNARRFQRSYLTTLIGLIGISYGVQRMMLRKCIEWGGTKSQNPKKKGVLVFNLLRAGIKLCWPSWIGGFNWKKMRCGLKSLIASIAHSEGYMPVIMIGCLALELGRLWR